MADETQPDTQAQSDTTPAADQNVQAAQTQDTATAPSTSESAPVSAPEASQGATTAPTEAAPADASASDSPPQEPAAPAADSPASSAPAADQPEGVVLGGSVVGSPDDKVVSDDVANPAKDKAPGTVTAQPVRVDGRNRRTDEDALEGHFVEVTGKGISGTEHDHQKAVFLSAAEYDQNTGYPTRALVRFKDATYGQALDVVAYEDLKPARANS